MTLIEPTMSPWECLAHYRTEDYTRTDWQWGMDRCTTIGAIYALHYSLMAQFDDQRIPACWC